MSRLPLIGITACSKQVGLYAYHISGDPYVHAVASMVSTVPLILSFPANLPRSSDILDGLYGIVFTDTLSNIEPFHGSGPAYASGTANDSARDVITLPLIYTGIGVPGPLYHATPMRQTTPDL